MAGKIGATGRQIVLRDLDKDPGELAYIDWLQREQIRGFNGVPIIYQGEVLGVIAVFSPHERARGRGSVGPHFRRPCGRRHRQRRGPSRKSSG